MKRLYIYMMVLILVSACAKKADYEAPEDISMFIVVDGILTNEARTQYLYIHFNKTDLNGQPIAVSGAEVIISNEESTFIFHEDTEEAGKYISDSSFAARLESNYSLLVIYNDVFYSAQAGMVAGKTFPELIYVQYDDELYRIDYVASAFEATDPAMWEILIDYSSVPGYENDPGNTNRLLFYTLPTLDVSQVFAPVVEQVSFPAGTKIDQRRYSLTDEHAAFIRTLLLETGWQGGVFPSDPANVSTNLSEGALGFFGVCAVNSLSLTVTP